jgi:hypothetical protein
VLIDPSWVLTCAHIGWPTGTALSCRLQSGQELDIDWLYNEAADFCGTLAEFTNNFDVPNFTSSQLANEGLALLHLERPVTGVAQLIFSSNGKDSLLVGFRRTALNCNPRITAGLHFNSVPWGSVVAAGIDAGPCAPDQGDSGGPVFSLAREGGQEYGIFAIQNAVSNEMSIVTAVPVASRLASIKAIISGRR